MSTPVRLEIQYNHPHLSRQDFRNLYKPAIGNPLFALRHNWVANLDYALREIVKNFYDHANKKGIIIVVVSEHEVTFEAYDFGPGYQGGSKEKDFCEIVTYHKKHGSSLKAVSKENLGMGINTIEACFKGLQQGNWVTSVDYEVQTYPNFKYKGTIRF